MIESVSYPTSNRNYCIFDEKKVDECVQKGEAVLPDINQVLIHSKNEDEIIECLYIINRLLDSGVNKQKISALYSSLSKYNNSESPNIQTFLAGIYRKTKIPDAFGPLIRMLIQDSINPPKDSHFDPTEEIGGAILDYLA